MIRWLFTLLSISGIILAIVVVLELRKSPPASPPRQDPPMPIVGKSPIPSPVSATGVVEAMSENILIGTNIPGVVAEVLVKVDDTVILGQPLFRLDDRQSKADLKASESKLVVAQAQLDRLKNFPRKEDLPPAEAFVKEAVDTNPCIQRPADQSPKLLARVLNLRQVVRFAESIRIGRDRERPGRADAWRGHDR